MARKLRIEVEGGLYHLIIHGNDRQDIFHSHEDRLKFLPVSQTKRTTAILSICVLPDEKPEFDSEIAFAKERVTSEDRVRIAQLQD